MNTKPLVRKLEILAYTPDREKFLNKNTLTELFIQLIVNFDKKQDLSGVLKQIKEKVGSIDDSFCGNSQKDAYEFLVVILPDLLKNLRSAFSKVFGLHSYSDPFQFQVSIITHCGTKHHKKLESRTSLVLPLPQDKKDVDINECFELFKKPQSAYCLECKDFSASTQQELMSSKPEVLIMYLQRTDMTNSGRYVKGQQSVEFDETDLDLNKYFNFGGKLMCYES